ncbi:MAG: endonuclease [Pseudomonadota bacterium]
MKASTLGFIIFLIIPTLAFGEPPDRPLKNFESAKKVARDTIYAGHTTDFYCGCDYTPGRAGSSGTIDPSDCGYVARKNKARGKKLEWEHVVPAYYFGSKRTCWKKGNAKCIKADGTPFKGRECCSRVDKTFQKIEADLHNLVPAVGELNGDRSNLPYGIVEDEPREYGACDFEIGGSPKATEPRDEVRGDAARIWLYMADTYRIPLTDEERVMFEEWSQNDPVDRWEKLRNRRIESAQENGNEYVK